ncbi:Uncharacterised protein [Citrobacter koseri]|nr:Uncharacterised protein [Citrobacter koseri]
MPSFVSERHLPSLVLVRFITKAWVCKSGSSSRDVFVSKFADNQLIRVFNVRFFIDGKAA